VQRWCVARDSNPEPVDQEKILDGWHKSVAAGQDGWACRIVHAEVGGLGCTNGCFRHDPVLVSFAMHRSGPSWLT
jgi:hypothetical protein